MSRRWMNPHAEYVIIHRSGEGSVFGGQKDEIEDLTPLTLKKNVKTGTLSWRSMENCSLER